jgi:hypothetical protein
MGTPGEMMYSSYSFITSALYGVRGQRHVPAALYPGGKNPQYPLNRRLGGPQNPSGHTIHYNFSYILKSANIKFRNKGIYRYGMPAYTCPFRPVIKTEAG